MYIICGTEKVETMHFENFTTLVSTCFSPIVNYQRFEVWKLFSAFEQTYHVIGVS